MLIAPYQTESETGYETRPEDDERTDVLGPDVIMGDYDEDEDEDSIDFYDDDDEYDEDYDDDFDDEPSANEDYDDEEDDDDL